MLLRRLMPLLVLMLGPGLLVTAQARELAIDRDELVVVELATVGMGRMSGAPVVLLREPKSGDVVPIIIGMAEARAILMAMHEVPVPRPMTHDLLRDLIGAMDARLENVLVDGLVDGTYLGMLELKLVGREHPVLVDTRPSDGLALAMRTGAGIYVAPGILQAGREMEFEGLEEDQVVTAIGITVVEATPGLREGLDLPADEGVVVSRATGHAAAVGIEPGSLIREVNGETPLTPMAFLDLVRKTPAGEQAVIRYWLDGEINEVAVSTDVPAPEEGGEAPLRGL
jgi:uncharacterized protein